MDIGTKGISRLAIIPVRANPSDKAELVTQLLFGEHYTVIAGTKDQKWLKVQLHFDAYEGWIDSKQHHAISHEYFDQINYSDYKIVTEPVSAILSDKHATTIVMGSILPISTYELFKEEEQLVYHGEAKSLSVKGDAVFLKQVADKYLNAPYLWGGRSPFGIDCSGFVQIVFKICGYKLLRDASQQAQQGEEIDFKDKCLGDLAFFKNEKGSITHVGIVLDEDRIIHASGKVRIDQLNEEGIYISKTRQKTHQLSSIRRVMRR